MFQFFGDVPRSLAKTIGPFSPGNAACVSVGRVRRPSAAEITAPSTSNPMNPLRLASMPKGILSDPDIARLRRAPVEAERMMPRRRVGRSAAETLDIYLQGVPTGVPTS
jgi:hypothetical protein